MRNLSFVMGILNMEKKNLVKLDILKKLSPGTGLRAGLDDIVNGRMGALIVVINPSLFDIFEGGFKVNCKFTSKRLAELAKLDGAIILSEDFKKILYVNALIVPDRTFDTSETGTRHQAAERVAKQTGCLAIAVSERRGKISVYYGNSRYVLQNTEELLRKTTETLQILEKQREVFNELLINLNILEITSLVSVGDICSILQRLEIIKKMSNIINEYILELGREGIIVRMRMKELMKGIEKQQEFVVRDYIQKTNRMKHFSDNLSFDSLLDAENIAKILFEESLETKVMPKGYRILSKTCLNSNEIKDLISKFKNLEEIFNIKEENLNLILKDKVVLFKKEIDTLKEQILMGKKI